MIFLHRSLSLYLVSCCLLAGCTLTASPTLPYVHTKELLLDAQAFPPNWDFVPCSPYCDRMERQGHSSRSFGRTTLQLPGHVIQDVFFAGSTQGAQSMFEGYRDGEFKVLQPPNKTFAPPIAVSYQSPLADAQYLACGIDTVPACKAIRQYGAYFVFLYFSIDPTQQEGMMIQDIEPILRDLDARVSEKLGISQPPTAPTSVP